MDQKLFVIGLRCGRLANRLILFANFLALAEEQKHKLVNVTFHSYAHLFETTRRDIYCRYPVPSRQSLLDAIPGAAPLLRKSRVLYHLVRTASVLNERFTLFGPKVVTLTEKKQVTHLDSLEVQATLDRARIVFVYGWRFRASTCVRQHAGKIRDYFQPVEEFRRAGSDVIDRLRQKADVVVGVHIRQGDYRTWRNGKYFYPASRYTGWMQELAGQFAGQKTAFFVCSDEQRNPQEFAGLTLSLGAGSATGDLHALSQCDYIIGAPSTFSQWASFYGAKPLLHLASLEQRIDRRAFKVSFLDDIPGTG